MRMLRLTVVEYPGEISEPTFTAGVVAIAAAHVIALEPARDLAGGSWLRVYPSAWIRVEEKYEDILVWLEAAGA